MKTAIRTAATVGASCALLIGAAGPAQAGAMAEKLTVELPAQPWVVCADGTELGVALTVDLTSQYWTDRDGEVTREKKHMQYRGALTNLRTGETRGVARGARTVHVDVVSGEAVSTGNYRTLTYPGAGAVLKAVGRDVYSATDVLLSSSGPDIDEATPAGAQALCALFGLPGGVPAPPPAHD